MLKLFGYLKKPLGWVILLIALLVVQAYCELSLPEYTSDIVDTGLSKDGIDERIPDYIVKTDLDTLAMFIDSSQKDLFERTYEPTDDKVDGDIVYEMSLEDKEEIEQMEAALAKPVALLGMMTSMQSEDVQANSSDRGSFDMQKMEDMFSPTTTNEDRINTLNEIFSSFDNMEDTMVEQMSAVYIKGEYEHIGIDMGEYQVSYLRTAGIKMVIICIIYMIVAIIIGLIASRTAAGIAKDLRNKVFRKVMSFSNVEMDRFSTASLITRSTNDIQQIQQVMVMLLRMIIYAPILAIGGIIKVFSSTASMVWLLFVSVILILFVVAVLFAVAMPKFKLMQTLVDKVNLVAREILTGIPVIRAFSTEKHEEERFDKANKHLMKTQLFTNRIMSVMMPFMMLIMNGISVAIIWFGGKGINDGSLQVGEMMAFMTYAMLIVISFLMLTMIAIMLPRAGVAATRIDEVLKTDVSIKDLGDKETNYTDGTVEFRDVSFRYPDAEEDVLSNISFMAKPGQTTAFIGSTGSGKSTLINLIPRFFDVTRGSILVDGLDIREMSLNSLRGKLGYVPQKGVLFSGTIESNIKFGKDELTLEEVKDAARIAQADDFIEEKEEKYDSPIAQGGTNVSGGQKQRLSIARAIAKNPEIYIFDDSFSALDFKTDIALRTALANATKNSTILIVAQRISTILNADQIVVLDNGEIVGKGTHTELIRNCEVYRQIAVSQLSEEEINNSLSEEKEVSHE